MCALVLESQVQPAAEKRDGSANNAPAERFLDRPGLAEELQRQLAEERTPVRLMNALVEKAWEQQALQHAGRSRLPRLLLVEFLLCTALLELIAATALVCTNAADFALYATTGMLGALCTLLGAAYWCLLRRSPESTTPSLLSFLRRTPRS